MPPRPNLFPSENGDQETARASYARRVIYERLFTTQRSEAFPDLLLAAQCVMRTQPPLPASFIDLISAFLLKIRHSSSLYSIITPPDFHRASFISIGNEAFSIIGTIIALYRVH